MSNTILQTPATTSYNATSVSRTFGSGCTAGSLLVCAVTQETASSGFTVADDANAGNYAEDAKASSGNTGTGRGTVGIYSMPNTATSAVTITATPTASARGFIATYEISGPAASGYVDDTATSAVSGSGTVNLALTTTAANCTVIAIAAGYPAGISADSGYTLRPTAAAGSVSYHVGEYDDDVGTAGSLTLSFGSWSPSAQHQAVAVAYAPDAGGSGVEAGAASSEAASTAIAATASVASASLSAQAGATATAAGAAIADGALSAEGAATATAEGAEMAIGYESGALSASAGASATATTASIAEASASAQAGAEATAATESIAGGDLSASAGATATAVGADANVEPAAATRYDGWLPRAVLERERVVQEDEAEFLDLTTIAPHVLAAIQSQQAASRLSVIRARARAYGQRRAA